MGIISTDNRFNFVSSSHSGNASRATGMTTTVNQLNIEHWDPELEGELTEKKLRRKLEEKGYSVTRYVYSPGTYFPDHTHGVEKIDAVLAGRFRMTMENLSVVLEAGDCLLVPQGAVHSAEVVGNESVISLDAIKR